MKLCFSTLGCCDRGLGEIIALANKYDIKNIEFRGIGGVVDNSKIQEFFECSTPITKEKLLRAGINPIVLGSSCSFHNAEQYNSSVAEGKKDIDIAERLGIPFIRVFGDRITDEDTVVRIISGLLSLCEYSQNVSVLLETHGDFNTVQTLAPIVDAMSGTTRFGLIWDIEHTHKVYGHDWGEFYSFARPHIRHVHIKDYSNSEKALSAIGCGDVPIKEIVDKLLNDGYDGCFSLEWEKKWHPELSKIEEALDDFVRIIK
jgi:sugar phosphate isomerase/epimerase